MTPSDVGDVLRKHRELETLISSHNWWLGVFTIIVAVGIFFEIAVEFIFGADKPRIEKIAITICGLVVLGGVIGEYLEGSRVADSANQLQTMADNDVGQLFKEAGDANERAAKAENETENEKSARVELQYIEQRFANGRHLKVMGSYHPFVYGTAPPAVLIQNILNDPEADRLACELAFVLAQWAHRVDANVSHIPDNLIPDGVTIQCSDCGSTDKSLNNTVRQAELLRQFFVSWPNVVAAKVSQLPPTIGVPKDGILILIGKHSIDFDMDALATDRLEADDAMDRLARGIGSRSAQPNWISDCVPKQ